MRKIILNPQYKSLYTFIETLPQNFNAGGEIVQDRRNTIKKFKVNGLEINVKRYRVPIFINRIAYTFFRKSKACRAYNNAFEVIKRGFETPESIAYIEEFKGGLLHYSYYISLQCPYRREIREYYQGPLQGNEALMTAFAQFTAALHEKGVCHEDYSPGNVLIAQIDGQYHFSLVDINRMTFKPMNLEEGCAMPEFRSGSMYPADVEIQSLFHTKRSAERTVEGYPKKDFRITQPYSAFKR